MKKKKPIFNEIFPFEMKFLEMKGFVISLFFEFALREWYALLYEKQAKKKPGIFA